MNTTPLFFESPVSCPLLIFNVIVVKAITFLLPLKRIAQLWQRPRELGDFKKARVNGGTGNHSFKGFSQLLSPLLLTDPHHMVIKLVIISSTQPTANRDTNDRISMVSFTFDMRRHFMRLPLLASAPLVWVPFAACLGYTVHTAKSY